MATADEVERLLQKAVADGLPPLTRLYHKGKAEPTAADAEPESPATQKAILWRRSAPSSKFSSATPTSRRA